MIRLPPCCSARAKAFLLCAILFPWRVAEGQPLRLVAEPPLISPREAAAHVDEVVSVETTIASASHSDGRLFLLPAGEDGRVFRIVFVPPISGEDSIALGKRYAGRRLRVTGRVREFGGTLEIFVSDSARLELVDGADRVDRADDPTARKSTVRPFAQVPEPPLPSPGATGTSGAQQAEVKTGAEDQGCALARDEWRVAAARARETLSRLDACLARGAPPCGVEAVSTRAALAEIAASEERMRWLCEHSP